MAQGHKHSGHDMRRFGLVALLYRQIPVIRPPPRGHSPTAMARLAHAVCLGLALSALSLLSCKRSLPEGRPPGGLAGAPGSPGAAGAGVMGGNGGVGAVAGIGGGAPGGAGGTATGGAGGQPPGGASTINLDGSPIYTRMQRLTNAQWERAVTDVLRFASPANLSQGFSMPVAAGATDFANNEKRLFLDQQAALDFEAGSEAAAALATGAPDALARLYPGTDAAGFVRTLGRRAFRRPLTADEEAKYQGVFATGERLYGAGFANGAALVIRAMLQSPKFLYRSELGPAGAPLDGYEVASKLSFWLLGTTPSDELLDAAAAGTLDSVAGLESAARAMLERPAAVEVMRDFHGQRYRLDLYGDVDRTDVPAAVKSELAETSASVLRRRLRERRGVARDPDLDALFRRPRPGGQLRHAAGADCDRSARPRFVADRLFHAGPVLVAQRARRRTRHRFDAASRWPTRSCA